MTKRKRVRIKRLEESWEVLEARKDKGPSPKRVRLGGKRRYEGNGAYTKDWVARKRKPAKTNNGWKPASKAKGKAIKTRLTLFEPNPDNTVTAPVRGRPSKYKPVYAQQVRFLCSLGACDDEIATFFKTDIMTVRGWAVTRPAFGAAMKVLKGEFDDKIERALAMRAAGYTYDAVKVMQHEGEPIYANHQVHVPPDPVAAKMWLSNRRRGKWKFNDADPNPAGGGTTNYNIDLTVNDLRKLEALDEDQLAALEATLRKLRPDNYAPQVRDEDSPKAITLGKDDYSAD